MERGARDLALQTTGNASLASILLGVKDNGPTWVTLRHIGYSADASSTALDVATPSGVGKLIIADDIHIGLSTTDAIVSLYEESNATALWTMPLTAGFPFVFTARDLFPLVTAGKKLQLKTSIAAPVYTWISYHEV
jgi:hypothetical protein